MNSLDEKLKELAALRKNRDSLDAMRDIADEALRETNEFAKLEEITHQAREVGKEVKELEEIIRDIALSQYTKLGAHNVPSVTIKNFKVLSVADDKTAKLWMANNAPALLSYSDSRLLKAVENLELDWATVEQEPRAQIASNLDIYLENENEQ